MSNALFCWAKPVNICPCSSCKIVPLLGIPLSSPTLNYIVSLFLVICLHHISSTTLISSTRYIPPLSLFIFSLLSLRLSGDRSAVHDCHGNNDGKTRWRSHSWPGLLYRGRSYVWKHQMLSLKFNWIIKFPRLGKLKVIIDILKRYWVKKGVLIKIILNRRLCRICAVSDLDIFMWHVVFFFLQLSLHSPLAATSFITTTTYSTSCLFPLHKWHVAILPSSRHSTATELKLERPFVGQSKSQNVALFISDALLCHCRKH